MMVMASFHREAKIKEQAEKEGWSKEKLQAELKKMHDSEPSAMDSFILLAKLPFLMVKKIFE